MLSAQHRDWATPLPELAKYSGAPFVNWRTKVDAALCGKRKNKQREPLTRYYPIASEKSSRASLGVGGVSRIGDVDELDDDDDDDETTTCSAVETVRERDCAAAAAAAMEEGGRRASASSAGPPAPTSARDIMRIYNIESCDNMDDDCDEHAGRDSVRIPKTSETAQSPFLKEYHSMLKELAMEHRTRHQDRIRRPLSKAAVPQLLSPSPQHQSSTTTTTTTTKSGAPSPVSMDYMHGVVQEWWGFKRKLPKHLRENQGFKSTLLKRRRENQGRDTLPDGVPSSASAVAVYRSRTCAERGEELTPLSAEELKLRFQLHICAVKTCSRRGSERFKLGLCQAHYMSYYRRQVPVRAEASRRRVREQEVLYALFSVNPTIRGAISFAV